MPEQPLIIIPARYGSTRLPGKPLKKIGNKTLIEHAVESSGNPRDGHEVVVATDNHEIAELMEPYRWVDCAMTDEDLETGTDRCAQAVEQTVGWEDAPDWIINVQGDMPFGTAPFVDRLIAMIQAEPHHWAITPMCEHVHVEFDKEYGYYTRKLIRSHVGMYAIQKDILKLFYDARNEPHVREKEKVHSLEQNRFLAMGYRIKHLEVNDILPPYEINTQADLDRKNQIASACTETGD